MSAGKPRQIWIPSLWLWPTHNSTPKPTPPLPLPSPRAHPLLAGVIAIGLDRPSPPLRTPFATAYIRPLTTVLI